MTKTPPAKDQSNEEPDIVQEESIPSDGKDRKGEQMMEELGRTSRRRPCSIRPPERPCPAPQLSPTEPVIGSTMPLM